MANGNPLTFNAMGELLANCCGTAINYEGNFGCTDSTAENYLSLATVDDGSCCFTPGCAN